MTSSIEEIRKKFSAKLEAENLNELQNLMKGLVESYKKVPEENKKKFGVESLKIFNMRNNQGRNAVMIAAERGEARLLEKWYDIPDLLTDNNYSLEELQEVYKQRISSYVVRDNEDFNALMFAIKNKRLECFPFLLSPETAITLNQKDKDGKTALTHAIESEDLDVIQEFLEVTEKILDGVNQYDPESEVKLKIDADTWNDIQNIKNENIKSLIIKFISESKEHIFIPCRIPLSLLNSEKYKLINDLNQSIEVIKKQSEEGSTLPAKISIPDIMQKVEQSIKHYRDRYENILSSETILPKEYQETVSELLVELEQKKEGLKKFLENRELSLKRKNTEQANGIPEKKRKEGGETIEERIPRLVNILEEKKGTISINGLISTRNFINDTNEKLPTRGERKDYKEVRQKLKELENKLQEVGKARLEKLLNEASVPDLTDKKKEEILSDIKKLVIEAKIEFSKDFKIPEIVKNKVKDIIPNSTINELASYSHSSPLQR